MRNICISNTDLSVSKFSLGTSRLHHFASDSTSKKYIFDALDNGITHFDTARMYGDGYSENLLGKCLNSNRSSFTISTKFGIPAVSILERFPLLIRPHRFARLLLRRLGSSDHSHFRDFSRKQLSSSLHKSLCALRTDYIDIYFLHEPFSYDYSSIQFLVDDLISFKQAGKFRYLGVCGEPDNCASFLTHFPGLVDIVQTRNSLSFNCLGRLEDLSDVHFTYGYLSSDDHPKSISRSIEILNTAANLYEGSILFSSRSLNSFNSILKSIS